MASKVAQQSIAGLRRNQKIVPPGHFAFHHRNMLHAIGDNGIAIDCCKGPPVIYIGSKATEAIFDFHLLTGSQSVGSIRAIGFVNLRLARFVPIVPRKPQCCFHDFAGFAYRLIEYWHSGHHRGYCVALSIVANRNGSAKTRIHDFAVI